MRTTLSLDDDVLQEVKAYAKSQDVAIGKAVSDLVRRGLHALSRPASSMAFMLSSCHQARPR
jgi:hypothetical protein